MRGGRGIVRNAQFPIGINLSLHALNRAQQIFGRSVVDRHDHRQQWLARKCGQISLGALLRVLVPRIVRQPIGVSIDRRTARLQQSPHLPNESIEIRAVWESAMAPWPTNNSPGRMCKHPDRSPERHISSPNDPNSSGGEHRLSHRSPERPNPFASMDRPLDQHQKGIT